DGDGRIVAVQVRREEEDLRKEREKNPNGEHSGKYTWLSSARKKEGVKAATHVHVPAGFDGCVDVVRVTEGALKANLATALSNVLTLAVPGVSVWRHVGLFEALEKLRCGAVRLAFDMDQDTNPHVALQLHLLAEELRSRGYAVEVERWDPAHKGIDDLL